MDLYNFSFVKTHLDRNYHRKEFSPTSVRYNNLLCLKKDMRRTSSPFSLHISQVLHSIHFHSYPRNVSPISPSSIHVGCPRYYDELHRIIPKKNGKVPLRPQSEQVTICSGFFSRFLLLFPPQNPQSFSRRGFRFRFNGF